MTNTKQCDKIELPIRKRGKKMKKYLILYTVDGGTTNDTLVVMESNYTNAYVSAMGKIPKCGEIRAVYEIMLKQEQVVY